MLSDRVKELIEQARIVSFATWTDRYPLEVIEVFQQADDEKRYLTDEDISKIQGIVPALLASLAQGKTLRDDVATIVSHARQEVLAAYPQITEPGGGLYPPMRAEACWRDFWHFLRCITYGISGQSVAYTSDRGLNYMKQLYQELEVPLQPMVDRQVCQKRADRRNGSRVVRRHRRNVQQSGHQLLPDRARYSQAGRKRGAGLHGDPHAMCPMPQSSA